MKRVAVRLLVKGPTRVSDKARKNQDVFNVQKYSNVQKVRYNNLFVLIGELREKDSRVRIKTPGAWHEVQDSR